MRQSEQQKSQQEYAPGTVVFAKLKGYPWWPARIEADHSVPPKVLQQRAKSKVGLYTVFFYGSRDYGFFGPDALKPFDSVKVRDELETKKYRSKDLENAVRQALDPSLLAQVLREEEEQAEEEEEEEEEVEEIKNSKGKGRKNSIGKRRSRKVALGDEDEVEETAIGNTGEKKKRRQSISMEEEEEAPKEDIKKTPAYKKIYHLRHRLQRLVYNKIEGEIPYEDYPKILEVVQEIEEAPLTYEVLRDTKINKVVRAACSYPFENDTMIKERCHRLMKNWKSMFIDPVYEDSFMKLK